MNVGELKKLLEGVTDESPVILQKDSEGNGYSPLAGGEKVIYVPDTTWMGTAYTKEEAEEEGVLEDERAEDAFVLFPVN